VVGGRRIGSLIAALFERASRKRVMLAGLDGQIGSTNLYAQTGLAFSAGLSQIHFAAGY